MIWLQKVDGNGNPELASGNEKWGGPKIGGTPVIILILVGFSTKKTSSYGDPR